ncbi:MAG: MerR family DNA-binding transcriptional regulator [Pseudomonadota bacterium]
MSEKTFSIGELCAEFDVTPRALRFYEYKELLAPIRDGQRRIFTLSDRARLKLILRGKRFGFSLAEIKDLLDLYHLGDGQVTQLAATIQSAERHKQELIAKRDELDGAIEDLSVQMATAEKLLAEKSKSHAAE